MPPHAAVHTVRTRDDNLGSLWKCGDVYRRGELRTLDIYTKSGKCSKIKFRQKFYFWNSGASFSSWSEGKILVFQVDEETSLSTAYTIK